MYTYYAYIIYMYNFVGFNFADVFNQIASVKQRVMVKIQSVMKFISYKNCVFIVVSRFYSDNRKFSLQDNINYIHCVDGNDQIIVFISSQASLN